jgi:hypothetical protein
VSSFVSYAAGSSVQKQDNFKWSYWLSVQTMVSSSTAKLDVCELFLAKWSFLILNHSTNPLEINLSLPLPQNIVARLRLIMLIFFVLITKKLWEQKPIPVNSLFHFCILSGFWSPWLATCQLCSICSTIRCWIWWTWLTTTLLSFSLSVLPSIKELKASPKLKQIFSTPQKLCYGKKPLHCAKKHSPTNPKSLSLIPISIRAINNSKKRKKKVKENTISLERLARRRRERKRKRRGHQWEEH